MSKEKYVATKQEKATKTYLLKKAEELISEAAKYAKMRDETWTLTYLRSAISVIEATRHL